MGWANLGDHVQQKILIIDDSREVHTLVTCLLRDEPVRVYSAFTVKVGIDLAASVRPDLILLDIEMPETDGFETCRRIKSNPALQNLPIIFLTGRTSTEEIVRGFDLGAVDYVTKPFVPPELVSRVRATLKTSRLIRLLEEEALIDSLTGLGNRRMFEERFAAEVGLRMRSGDQLACIMVDVDDFKHVNDQYGHLFGDQVLRKIGETLYETSRIEDVACRYGGEEFAVLLPRTSAQQAARLAERMRIAIAHILFSCAGESVKVTCSFGVAEAVGSFGRLMLERADQALYQSKKLGRNRVSVAPKQPVTVGFV
jgi:diguanylate cyclase (GGDEF)-like protein